MRTSEKLIAIVSIAVPLVVIVVIWQMVGGILPAPTAPEATPAPQVAGTQATATPPPSAPAARATTSVAASRPTTAARATPVPTSAVSEPTEAPAVAAAPSGLDQAGAASGGGTDPGSAVATFYTLVSNHEFDAAALLWTPRMRSNFPPDENINQRFAQTTGIQLQRDEVVTENGSQAVVSVDLVESLGASGRRHYVGDWYLIRTSTGWQLDQPQLHSAP